MSRTPAREIADPKRLRRICTLMEDHGEWLQYSVFLRDLTVAELAELESVVLEVMVLREGSVVRIDLRPLDASATGPRPGPSSASAIDRLTDRMITASGLVQGQTPGTARMQVRGPFRVFRRPSGHAAGPSAGDRSQDGVSCLVTGHVFGEP